MLYSNVHQSIDSCYAEHSHPVCIHQYALQMFPGQSLSRTDISWTSYTNVHNVNKYQLYRPSHMICRYMERLMMYACRPAVSIRGLFSKACSSTMGKA